MLWVVEPGILDVENGAVTFLVLNRRRFLGVAGSAAAIHATPAWARVVTRPQHLIMLDPGHGGLDPGCIGTSGIYEKDIALATAQEFARELEATGKFRVKLTRTDDEFV